MVWPLWSYGRWGSHVGVIDLELKQDKGEWKVVKGEAQARPIFDQNNNKSLAQADPDMVKALTFDHKGTRDFVNQPIGKASGVMYSYLALVQDDQPYKLSTWLKRIMSSALFKETLT